MIDVADCVAREDASDVSGRRLEHGVRVPRDDHSAGDDAGVIQVERVFRRAEPRLPRAVGVRDLLAPVEDDRRTIVRQRVERHRNAARQVVDRSGALPAHRAVAVVGDLVVLAERAIRHLHRARRGHRRHDGDPVERAVLLPDPDPLAVGRLGHFNQARRGGDRGLGVPARVLIKQRRLGACVGYELGVDRVGQHDCVANVDLLGEGHDAVIDGSVGNDGVARLGLRRVAGERAVGRRAGKVEPKRIAQVARDDQSLIVGGAARDRERPFFRRHPGDPNVLLVLGDRRLVHAQQQRATDWRRRDVGPREQLDRALPGDVVLVEVPRPLGASVQVRLDPRRGVLAPIEHRARREHRHADQWVFRRIGDDDVGPEEPVAVVGLYANERLAQRDLAAGPVEFADVVENAVARAVGDDDGRRGAAALGDVVHDFGRDQLDIASEDAHAITRSLMVAR